MEGQKVSGVIAGKAFSGVIEKCFQNGKVHIDIIETENAEWQRDISRGYPVGISTYLKDVNI